MRGTSRKTIAATARINFLPSFGQRGEELFGGRARGFQRRSHPLAEKLELLRDRKENERIAQT
jgi:hypothetical protein